MFNQRSAFDEALSRPLVPSNEDGGTAQHDEGGAKRKKTKKKKGKIGMSGRGSHSPARAGAAAPASGGGASTGRLPSFGGAAAEGGYAPPSAGGAPPSAVSSVVSEDDAPHQQQSAASAAAAAFDPALSSTFETSHADRMVSNAMELEQEEEEQQQHQSHHQQRQRELRRHESLDEALLRERNTALAEVTRNMGLVHTIQRELSSLVQGQQEDIDDIEANAIEVHEATERGVDQLERARAGMRDGCGSKWREAVLASVGGTATVAAVVFWLLAK